MRVKRIAILALFSLLIIAQRASAQDFDYFGAGYNMAFLKSDQLDFVVDRYNETRTYLTEEMNYPRYFDGISLHGGIGRNAFLFNFGYTQQSSVVGAEGVDASGVLVRREVKDKWNTIDIGLGVNLGSSDTKALSLGVNFGLNSEKSLTRADAPDAIGKANFEQVNKQFKIGISPFAQFIVATEDGVGILFRPYYAWSPVKTDYTNLNEYINPYTAIGDPYPLESTLKGFGISILIVAFDGYDY